MDNHIVKPGITQPVAATRAHAPTTPPEQAAPPALPKDSVELQTATDPGRRKFSRGNRVVPLIDGAQIFPEAKSMLEGAKSRIQLEMYELSKTDMVDLLVKEAKQGVQVQVILDPNLGRTPDEDRDHRKMIRHLVANGVKVMNYPVNEKLDQINHVKMLIVDGKSLLIGGMNWGAHSPFNHDMDVKIEGPAVNGFARMFADDWKISGGRPYKESPRAQPVSDANAEVMGIKTDLEHQEIKTALLGNINAAKKSIRAELFFLTDKDTLDAFIKAHQRGVDVRVIMDPSPMNGYVINSKAFKTLNDAGIEVRWFKADQSVKQKLHAKIAMFDGEKTVLGSANWTHKGFYINREADVNVKSPDVTHTFEAMFDRDWDQFTTPALSFRSKPPSTPQE